MGYKYYLYAPIGLPRIKTTCIVRYKDGIFEEYVKGEWVATNDFYAILIGEDDNMELVSEKEAMDVIALGNL